MDDHLNGNRGQPTSSREPRFSLDLRNRVLQGEEAAIVEFWDKLLPFLRGALYKLLKGRHSGRTTFEEDLEDLVRRCAGSIAENEYAVLRRWDPKQGRSLDTFLWQRADWTCRDAQKRARGRPSEDSLDDVDWSMVTEVAQLSPEEQVSLRQRVQLCRDAVEAEAFEELWWKHAEGLSGEDIIKNRGGDPRDSKQRAQLDNKLSRLCKRLRKILLGADQTAEAATSETKAGSSDDDSSTS